VREEELLLTLKAWREDRGEPDTLLLSALRQALVLLSGRTNLNPLPEALAPAALELAAGALNRRGQEGEAVRREGGLSVSFGGLSPETARLIRRYLPAEAGFPDASGA
jgi:hypothetical protein